MATSKLFFQALQLLQSDRADSVNQLKELIQSCEAPTLDSKSVSAQQPRKVLRVVVKAPFINSKEFQSQKRTLSDSGNLNKLNTPNKRTKAL